MMCIKQFEGPNIGMYEPFYHCLLAAIKYLFIHF